MKKEIYKKLPASEDAPGVICRTKFGKEYRITQARFASGMENRFTLWEVLDNGYRKIAVEPSPFPLYDIVKWKE